MPNISIGKSISLLQSAVVCGHCVRRIENTQSARRGKREVFSISRYEKIASIDVRRARLEAPNISIDKSISRLQSAVVCDHCVWRIENTQSARRGKREVFSISPYERMASLEGDGVSVWRIEGEQHIRHTNVTTPSISPYERMAAPERDIPCCAGTGPRSLRKDGVAEKGQDGFAGRGRAGFPYDRLQALSYPLCSLLSSRKNSSGEPW